MARRSTKVPVKKKKTAKRKSKARKSLARASETVTPLASLREEVDNLFERFSEDWPSLPRLFGRGWTYPFADLERHVLEQHLAGRQHALQLVHVDRTHAATLGKQ